MSHSSRTSLFWLGFAALALTGCGATGDDLDAAPGASFGDRVALDVDGDIGASTAAWTQVASMSAQHTYAAALTLPSGRVLVVGDSPIPEIYDPVLDTWIAGPDLGVSYSRPPLVLLDDGRVLISGTLAGTTLLYDETHETWTPAAPLVPPRLGHSATRLPDGRVLFAGGWNGNMDHLDLAQIYDPATDSYAEAEPSLIPQGGASVTPLADGQILFVAGAADLNGPTDTQIYDPGTGAWHLGPRSNFGWIDGHVVLLDSGEVLSLNDAQGEACTGPEPSDCTVFATAERYDPVTATWTTAAVPNVNRWLYAATKLTDGRVLVSGGSASGGQSASAGLYDPGTDTWTTAGEMPLGRLMHNSALLHDGRVLIAGGVDEKGQPVLPAAIFDPTALDPSAFDPTTPVDNGAEDSPAANPTHEPGTRTALHLGCALGTDGSTPAAWSALGLLAALALRRRRA